MANGADRGLSVATDLLARWHDGYINGMSPDDFQQLLSETNVFLNDSDDEPYDTDRDPGDESDSYGHGV